MRSDLKRAKKFQDFINSLTAEDAKILFNEKATIEEEKQFLKNALSVTKKKNEIYLVAEFAEKIIGTASIEKDKWRRNHIGKFGKTKQNMNKLGQKFWEKYFGVYDILNFKVDDIRQGNKNRKFL